jgi:uncharacterized repeat protein (TIGR02543 family)
VTSSSAADYARPHAPAFQRTPWVSALLALAVLFVGAFVPASATVVLAGASAGAWPAAWSQYTYADGTTINDVNGDQSPGWSDLASGTCSGCAGLASTVALTTDGTNVFFRMRMAVDNNDAGKGALFNGAFLVQIADENNVVRAVVGVDGKPTDHDYVYVSDAVGGTVTQVYRDPFTGGSPSSAAMRWISTADGTGQYFLDFQVPLSAITTASGGAVNGNTGVKLYYGSSAAANLATINKDFMLGNVGTVDFTGLAIIRLNPSTYTVAFDANGGSPTPTSQSVVHGSYATAPTAPTRDGYVFTGWYTAASGGTAWTFATSAVTGATTLYAHWANAVNTVTFDSNGGSAVDAQNVAYGEAATEPTAPTREGYSFDGWFTEATGGSAWSFSTAITAPVTVHAQWTVNSYTVSFDSDGGSSVDDQNVDHGGTATEPTAPTREGYTFVGWFDGEGEPFDFTTPITSATSVVAHWEINTYTVSFDSDGGSSVDDQSVDHGGTATEPADPTREGYTFAGWVDGEGEPFDFTTPITGATTIVATWDINTYTVSFDTDGGSSVDDQNVDHGSTATEPNAPTREGYTFLGWVDGEGEPFDFTAPITGATTVVADWVINSYTVTFNANGGSSVDEQDVDHGSTATEPTAPTRDGYAFLGWYDATDNGDEWDFSTPVTGDQMLYAYWKLNAYNVDFDANGGSAVDGQVVDHGQAASEPTEPTRTGYTFAGWYDASTGGEEWDFSDTITGATTIYAHWTINSYAVSFDANGGSTVDGQTVEHGSAATEPTDPTRTGYTFIGWYGAADGGDEWDFTNEITEATTLYAQWQLNSYAVTFDTTGGTTVAGQTVDHGDKASEPGDPTRTGYTFLGWYDAETGGSEWDFATEITEATTLYAQWQVVSYAVTFDANGGSAVAGQTVDYGSLVVTPTVPTRAGYTFAGWWTAASGGTAWVFGSDVVTGDVTLYAHWTPVPVVPPVVDPTPPAPVTPTPPVTPAPKDSDGDGLSDVQELAGAGGGCATDPSKADTDGDGLSDGSEVKGNLLKSTLRLKKGKSGPVKVRTNPCKKDTDKDGLSDYKELKGKKVGKKLVYRSNPRKKDSDHDGLSDKAEVTGKANKLFWKAPSNPMDWDTDRGNVSDGAEVRRGSDPTRKESWPGHPGPTSGKH